MAKKTKLNKKRITKKAYNVSNRVIILVILLLTVVGLVFFVKNQPVERDIIAIDQSPKPRYLAQANSNAFLAFDPTSKKVQASESFDVKVMVNTAGSETLSTDAYVIFDGDKIQAVSVQQGDFFPSVGSTISSNSVILRGMVTEPASFRKGTGLLATIKFKAIKQGVASGRFYCDLQAGDTSKIIQNDIDAQNIINCSGNNTFNVTIGNVTVSPSGSPPPCKPEKDSGWEECRYGTSSFNLGKCRDRAEKYKGVNGPKNGSDKEWFEWAQNPPKSLSCGTSCSLAPSYCNGSSVSTTPKPTTKPTTQPVDRAKMLQALVAIIIAIFVILMIILGL